MIARIGKQPFTLLCITFIHDDSREGWCIAE
jgi:hypothetical protein